MIAIVFVSPLYPTVRERAIELATTIIKDIPATVSKITSFISKSDGTDNSTKSNASASATTASGSSAVSTIGLRKDFKEAMDSYESFMDEYCNLMLKLSKNPSSLSLLTSFSSYMAEYANVEDKFEKWESNDLNDAELAYYIDVQARVTKKLLEAGAAIN